MKTSFDVPPFIFVLLPSPMMSCCPTPPKAKPLFREKIKHSDFKITHFSPKHHIPILSLYLISGQILNKKESDYDTKVQMTHQTLTSLKDKRKCCSLKSSTANHSGNREHKVHRPRQAWGRGAAPRTGDGVELQKAYLGVVFWVFVCLFALEEVLFISHIEAAKIHQYFTVTWEL